MTTLPGATARARGFVLFVVASLLVGLNLRGAIVGVPPLIPLLADSLGSTQAALALMTSIPLACFALVAPVASIVAERIGADRAILAGLALLVAALALRPWGGFGALMVGTVGVGIAIAAGNVLLPAIVRSQAGARAGVVMGAVTASYGIGASVAASAAVPVADAYGWRFALAYLAIPASIALAACVMQLGVTARRNRLAAAADAAPTPAARATFVPWRHGGVWALAVFFGLQSALFFSTSTWLPSILGDLAATSATGAGIGLSLFQAVGVAGMIAVPVLLRWIGSVRVIALGSMVAWAALFLGLALLPAAWPVWCALGGFAQGAGVSAALVLVTVRPAHPAMVARVSAMVQSLGYGMAVVLPIALAGIADATRSWAVPVWTCVVLVVVMAGVAVIACSARPIGSSTGVLVE